MSLKCPLCGNNKTTDSLFCSDCTEKFNNEYEVNIPASENSSIDKDIEKDNNKEKEQDKEKKTENKSVEKRERKATPTKKYPTTSRVDNKAWKRQRRDKRSDSQKSYYEMSKEKKSNKARWIFILLFILVLGVVGGLYYYNKEVKSDNLERSKWEVAQRENTVDSYLNYIDEYPEGAYIDEAQTLMFTLKDQEADAWQKLKTSENTVEFTDFLERYTESPYTRKVKDRLDSLTWEATLKENTTEAYNDYIEKSNSKDITGDYIGIANKRYKMLNQTTHVDERDLESIRETVDGFFVGLSKSLHAELNEYLSPIIVRFNNSVNIPSEKMIGQLLLLASKADAQSLTYEPAMTNIKYERMGNGTYKVNVPVEKIFEGGNGNINQIKGYIVHLKLNAQFRIYSYHETKPFSSAP